MKNILITSLLLISIVFIQNIAIGQLISSDPALPTADDFVTITFDASLGSGGLAGYQGDVYAHTGVITDESSSPSDWKYVIAGWGVNVPECKMTRIGFDLYELEITPTVREYYGVPANEQILQMAFVFRSAIQEGGNWLEGKTENGGDIFVDVFDVGLNVRFIKPDQNALIVELNDTIEIEAEAVSANTISLYLNDIKIKEEAGNHISDTLIADEFGKYWVEVIAENDTGFVADSFYYFVRHPVVISPLPEGVVEGINYVDDNTVILCLYAPNKEYVFAIGDFSNWEVDTTNYMFQTPDNTTYWVQINDLVPGQEYIFQYFVDGEIIIGDPYADKTSDPWHDKYITDDTYPDLIPYPEGKTNGIATVFQTAQIPYQWQYPDYELPEVTDMVVYELLIRDFTFQHNYQSLIDTLGYLKNLGINTIELMPVNEFEGNISWGYNPSYYFAPDKYYGTKNMLKEFIDECHKENMAVVSDMVLNHSFGQSPMVMLYWDSENNRPAEESPWYNPIAKHDYNVGYDINHESDDTKRFVDRVVKHWINEYKVDGYRFDLSKGFTQTNTLGNTWLWGQLDPSRIEIWKRIADSIWSVNPDTYVILEHFAENDEETILANYGMLIWGNENYHYLQAAMGWNSNSDFSWASYQERGWDYPHAVVYMESHDEERMMYKNIKWGNSSGDYDVQDSITALKRGEIAATFFFTIPGPKMVWQFGELGYDYTINYNGRTGPKPIRWDYYDDYQRKYLHDFYAVLIKLKQEQNVFRTENYTLSLAGPMKRIKLNDNPMSATIIGNFDVIQGSINPAFHHPGKWYEYFTHDSITVIDINEEIVLEPGEYRLYTDIKLEKPDLNTGIISPTVTSENLSSVYPNPSSDGFNIKFLLKNNADVELVIFNGLGQEVKTLMAENLPAGEQVIYWDGTDHHGKKAEKGLYFYQLTIDQYQELRKLIIF